MTQTKTWNTKSPEETVSCGQEIAKLLKPGMVVGLQGDLGAGKTTLIKGIASGLGLENTSQVKSPTFVIFHIYNARVSIYHFDLYRLNKESDLDGIGIEEFLADPEAVSLVEWIDKIPSVSSQAHIQIKISDQGENDRLIRITHEKSK